jgi:hypothetical protein
MNINEFYRIYPTLIGGSATEEEIARELYAIPSFHLFDMMCETIPAFKKGLVPRMARYMKKHPRTTK